MARGLPSEPDQDQVSSSTAILERFRHNYTGGNDIDLTLRPPYLDLLKKLGNPQDNLPPVFHVAGTNGKGSTCAFLRSMLEAAGYTVHVYTSPHLVDFRERIRIAGELISESALANILTECEKLAAPGSITYFEVSTAAALAAFARHPADFTILETGLGGRLDATNVVNVKLATLITRLSFDHREFLGDTMAKIATEKAGIMREKTPCFAAHQTDNKALTVLRNRAYELHAPISIGGEDWKTEMSHDGFHFSDADRHMDLPRPALIGAHQFGNAGLAIAALSVLSKPIGIAAIKTGLQKVEWPARLQRLENGALVSLLPPHNELWLDGGHNDSAGEVLAEQIQRWRDQDGADPRPLCVVLGMLTTKVPKEFLSPFAAYISDLRTVSIPGEALSLTAGDLAHDISKMGIQNVSVARNIPDALKSFLLPRARILICGSLYLAGDVLKQNGA